jgi:hypothetical protein
VGARFRRGGGKKTFKDRPAGAAGRKCQLGGGLDELWIPSNSKEIRAHGEQEARRLIREGLAAAVMEAEDLPKRAGSDPIKSVLAEIVWSRTWVGMEWIAKALHRRSAGNVRQQIHRWKAGKIPQRDKKAEKLWTKEFKRWRK